MPRFRGQTLLAALAVLAAAAAAVALAYLLRGVLLPFALALVLAYLLAPAVEFLCRRGWSRRASIAAVYLLLGAAGALLGFYLLPRLLEQLDQLVQALPRLARRLQDLAEGWERRYRRLPLPGPLQQAVEGAAAQAEAAVQGLAQAAVGAAMAGATFLLSALLAPFLAYYMLRDLELFRARFFQVVPHRWRPRTAAVLRDLDRVIGGFVRGQLLVALIMGSAAGLLTGLLGLPFPLLLGLGVGLGQLVPYFGPVLGSLPALAVAALHSPGALLRLVVFLAVLHELEQAVLTPRILGAGVGMHPLAVVLALLVGAQLMGAFGLLVAVPAAAAAAVLVRHAVAELQAGGARAAPADGRDTASPRQAEPVHAGE